MATKAWAIKLATEAARTVLSVDQIIVARQAGGPKPPGPNPVSYAVGIGLRVINMLTLLCTELGRGLVCVYERKRRIMMILFAVHE